MRDGCRAEGGGEVIHVCAEAEPLEILELVPNHQLCPTTATYNNEQSWHCRGDSQRKEQRDDFGRILGIGTEYVMDLGLLAVPEGLLVGRHGGIGIKMELEIKERNVETLG